MIPQMSSQPTPVQLEMERCPHCKISTPNLHRFHGLAPADSHGKADRVWGIYACARCGWVVSAAWSPDAMASPVPVAIYPSDDRVDESIDAVAREYLKQCKDSLHAPAGAVMLAASAVDAMLKAKGYKDGNLFQRIEKAAGDHVITADMSKWAHQVRLDANDQRHADEGASFPTEEEAQRSLDFALALAEILFVLPARVTRGQKESGFSSSDSSSPASPVSDV